jgi:hypothetical protein
MTINAAGRPVLFDTAPAGNIPGGWLAESADMMENGETQ